MENPDIDRPAVHIGFPFFAALFVASFFGAPFAAVSAVLLFAAVFLLLLFKQHRQRPNFVLSLIATAAAFAVFAVAMNLFVLPTERYDGGTYTVTGNVESFLTKSNGRFYYKLHVTHIDEPVQDVDFSVRLSHSEAFPAEIGDTVTCEAKFFAFEDSLGLSPRTSWLADNMVLSAYVTDYESVQVTPAEKRPFSYYVNQIRTHFHNLILENYPKTEGSVLSAMLLGLRNDMETELVSGAGKTFETYPDILDNVIPYIGGEEEKSEQEPMKLWGHIEGDKIVNATTPSITAQCFRVPVSDGHTAAVFVSMEKKVSPEEIIRRWTEFRGPAQELELPSAPKQFLHYFTEADRPQAKLDRELEHGMAVSIGRLRPDTQYDYKFVCLSHNTLRGAAGGGVLLAELLAKKGYFD